MSIWHIDNEEECSAEFMKEFNVDREKAKEIAYSMASSKLLEEAIMKNPWYYSEIAFSGADEGFISLLLQNCLSNGGKVYLDENEKYELLQNTPNYKWKAINIGGMRFPVVKVKSESSIINDEKKERFITLFVIALATIVFFYCVIKGYIRA